MGVPDPFVCFADYVVLVYHEARNVRHLAKAGHVDKQQHQRLINLPVNREEAWRAMQPLRLTARKAASTKAVEAVFREKFGLSLEDLEDLFNNSNWKHSRFGGNAWAAIVHRVMDLRQALDQRQEETASRIADDIGNTFHNTNFVCNKLRELDAALNSDKRQTATQEAEV